MELSIIRAIQSIANPVLDLFFTAVTILAEQNTVVIVIAVLFWCVDKRRGERMGFCVFLALLLGNGLKNVFLFPRPIGEVGIRTLRAETATGYSFPSGHSVTAGAVYTSVYRFANRRAVRVFCAAVIPLVMFSRLYLGVHYPKDVLVGAALGVGCAFVGLWLTERREDPLPVYLGALAVVLIFLFFPLSEDFVKALGSFAGFIAGVLFERRFVNFSTEAPLPRKILRAAVGLGLLLGVKEGLALALPDALVFDALRYAAVTFSGLGLYPMAFRKLI